MMYILFKLQSVKYSLKIGFFLILERKIIGQNKDQY